MYFNMISCSRLDDGSCYDYMDYHFSAAVDDDGKLYMWGGGEEPESWECPALQLLRNYVDENCGHNSSLPTLAHVTDGETVEAVSLGRSYALALTAQGKVFAWGRGGSGQLGVGDTWSIEDRTRDAHDATAVGGEIAGKFAKLKVELTQSFTVPTELLLLLLLTFTDKRIAKVSAGSEYSMALTDTGKVLKCLLTEWLCCIQFDLILTLYYSELLGQLFATSSP